MSPLRIFQERKSAAQKLAMISLYDAPSAKIACESGADALLVGDSLGNVVLGFDSTVPVTMGDMIRHTGAVARGAKSSSRPDVPVISDLPFGSYSDERSAIENGVALMQNGAHALKLEGGSTLSLRAIETLVQTGAPVMGHLGFTPQSSLQMNQIVQGKDDESARRLLRDAQSLQEAGCFAVVLEAVALETAEEITRELSIPTIGIGAGAACDGQVLVWHDLIGWSDHNFRFVKKYADAKGMLLQATQEFVRETQSGAFPTNANGWKRDV
jgi:3-methyl-2-oxobutanoate hydroxymethyltransferase